MTNECACRFDDHGRFLMCQGATPTEMRVDANHIVAAVDRLRAEAALAPPTEEEIEAASRALWVRFGDPNDQHRITLEQARAAVKWAYAQRLPAQPEMGDCETENSKMFTEISDRGAYQRQGFRACWHLIEDRLYPKPKPKPGPGSLEWFCDQLHVSPEALTQNWYSLNSLPNMRLHWDGERLVVEAREPKP